MLEKKRLPLLPPLPNLKEIEGKNKRPIKKSEGYSQGEVC